MSTRRFSRVRFKVAATITVADHRFQGEVENLSMTGMYLVTTERLALADAVEIAITLVGALPEVVVRFDGRVSRIDENGLAFRFELIDLDSYLHLKNIIAYNSDDPDKVLEEIGQSIDARLAAHP